MLSFLLLTAWLGQWSDTYGNTFNNAMSASMSQEVQGGMATRRIYRMILRKRGYPEAELQKMNTDQLYRAIVGSEAAAAKPKPAPASPTAKWATTFQPAAKRVMFDRILDSLSPDKDKRDELAPVLLRGIELFEDQAKKMGCANDVAASLAWFATATFALNGDSDPSDAGVEQLVNDLRQVLNTPQTAQIADLDKQRLYEVLVTVGTFYILCKETLKGPESAETLKTVRKQSADLLKQLTGIEVAKYRIGDGGLTIR